MKSPDSKETWEDKFKRNLDAIIDNYNPHWHLQPRGPDGRWESVGGSMEPLKAPWMGDFVPGAKFGPPEPAKREWTDVGSLPQASDRLLGMGVRSVYGADRAEPGRVLSQANRAGETLTDMFNKRPGLVDRMAGVSMVDAHVLRIEGKTSSVQTPEGDWVAGYWNRGYGQIVLPGGMRPSKDGPVVLGSKKHTVGTGFENIYRHELGHWMHETLLRPNEQGAWNRLYRDTSGVAPKDKSNFFSKSVSRYAGTNAREAFAESFAAWTHPRYGESGSDRLPEPVERYFNDTFGG